MKSKKTIESLVEAFAPRIHELTYEQGDEKLVVKVYPVLPFMQRAQMAIEIADGVFIGKEKTLASYHPEMLEYMKKYATISYFTDIKIPAKVENSWLLLNYTPVYNDVAGILGDDLTEIFEAADKIIEARKEYLVRKTDFNSILDMLGGVLKNFEAKISKEDIDKAMESLKGLTGNETFQTMVKALMSVNKA